MLKDPLLIKRIPVVKEQPAGLSFSLWAPEAHEVCMCCCTQQFTQRMDLLS